MPTRGVAGEARALSLGLLLAADLAPNYCISSLRRLCTKPHTPAVSRSRKLAEYRVGDEVRRCVCVPACDGWYSYIDACSGCLSSSGTGNFWGQMGRFMYSLYSACRGGPDANVTSDGFSLCATEIKYENCISLNDGSEGKIWVSFRGLSDGRYDSNQTHLLNLAAARANSTTSTPTESTAAKTTATTTAPTGSDTTASTTPTITPATGTGSQAPSTTAVDEANGIDVLGWERLQQHPQDFKANIPGTLNSPMQSSRSPFKRWNPPVVLPLTRQRRVMGRLNRFQEDAHGVGARCNQRLYSLQIPLLDGPA